MNINKEQLKGIGNIGLKIGKAIVVEGTKALLLKGAAVAITTSFEGGLSAVKGITLDDVIGKKDSNLLGFMNKDKKEEGTQVIIISEDEMKRVQDMVNEEE